mgnify:CR=1 FL=1
MATWIRTLLVVTIVAITLATFFDYPSPQTGFTSGDICNAIKSYEIGLGDDISTEFGNELDYGDLCLTKENVNIGGNSANTREIIFFNHKNKSFGPQTALTASEDYSSVVLEAKEGSIKAFYIFDNGIDLTKATADNPLEIKFLGQNMRIWNIADSSFTAVLGDSSLLFIGESRIVEGKRVTLKQISSDGKIAVDVAGQIEIISRGSTKKVNNLHITNQEAFYDSQNTPSSFAEVSIGADTFLSVTDGNYYVNTTQWRWDVGNLASTDPTTTKTDLEFDGPYIGIENADEMFEPVGSLFIFPKNFLNIKSGLTKESYTTIEVDREDLNTGSSVIATTHFRANENELRFGGKRLKEAWIDTSSSLIYYEESGTLKSASYSGSSLGKIQDIDVTISGSTYTLDSPLAGDDTAFAFSGSSLSTATWDGKNIKDADGKLITKHGLIIDDTDDDNIQFSVPENRVKAIVSISTN